MKPCPYCLAELENAALQCPYCQRWLDPRVDSTLNADSPPIVLPPPRTSGLAIGSLICAIFGWGPGSIAAVILGHVALRQIRRDPLRIKGKRMATTGIVLGWLGIVALTVILCLGIYFRKMFEEQPRRPQTREVNLTTAGLVRHREISPPHASIAGAKKHAMPIGKSNKKCSPINEST